MLYLDHAASSPVRPEAWAAMEPFRAGVFGNSSGAHASAREAKNALEDARDLIAELLGADPLEIVFTGGGTEADNLAIKGSAFAQGRRGGVVTTPIEHDAILESAEFAMRLGCELTYLAVDNLGLVDPSEVTELVNRDTAVVSVMMGNNETGVLEPVQPIAVAAHAASPQVAVHTDAVQGYVSEAVDVNDLGVDLLSLAAHKFGGPKGVGVLYVRSGTPLEPVVHGGGQELGRRSGTHNVMGAVGMAAAMNAVERNRSSFRSRVSVERDAFEDTLARLISGLVVTVADAPRMVQTSHVRMPGVLNETLLMRLDRAEVAASAASACQSGAATVSHVLEAMGLTPAHARESARFSFGWDTAPGTGERAASIVAAEVGALLS